MIKGLEVVLKIHCYFYANIYWGSSFHTSTQILHQLWHCSRRPSPVEKYWSEVVEDWSCSNCALVGDAGARLLDLTIKLLSGILFDDTGAGSLKLLKLLEITMSSFRWRDLESWCRVLLGWVVVSLVRGTEFTTGHAPNTYLSTPVSSSCSRAGFSIRLCGDMLDYL